MEKDQLNWERALHDVMDIICHHVNGKDLCNMAKVSKSWNKAALREKSKRTNIQRLRLNYGFSNLENMLDFNPYASLLIYDENFKKSLSSLPEKKLKYLEEELLEHLKRELPMAKTIVLKVHEYLTTEDLDPKDLCKMTPDTGNRNILGLLFPNVKKARVNVACINDFDYQRLGFMAQYIAEELKLKDLDYPRSTLLLFVETTNVLPAPLIDGIIKRVEKQGKENTWTIIYGSWLTASNSQDFESDRSNYRQSVVAIRISGPGVKSWSTFIFVTSHLDEIERKLQGLKEKLTPGRHCTGLLYSPKCYEPGCTHFQHPCGNSQEIMRNVKRIFPDIPFMGLFNATDFSVIPQNDEGKISYERLGFHELFMRIIIISYD